MSMTKSSSICRTCLAEYAELNNIFNKIEFENETLRICDMISLCMGLEIRVDDTLTKYICHKCDQEITRFYIFRKKCYESEVLLQMKQEQEVNKVSEELEEIFETTDGDIFKESDDDTNEVYLEAPLENETVLACDIKLMIKPEEEEEEEEEAANVSEEEKLSERIKQNSISDDDILEDTEEKSDKKVKLRLNQFPTPQKCDFCRKKFLSIRAYTSHIETHSKTTEYLCNICGQVFRTKSTHRDHMYRHANRNRCSICEKNFSSPFQLRLHMYKHTGEKPHKCEVCGASYAQLSYFKIHMRIHTGEKPYKCRYCDKSFTACNSRTKHEIDHQDPAIRPFQCHICPKNFRKKENYRKHLLTHTGEKSQKCPYCDKSFLFRKGLVVHMRSHTGEKPHECQYCEKKFSQKHCLVSHIASHHKFNK